MKNLRARNIYLFCFVALNLNWSRFIWGEKKLNLLSSEFFFLECKIVFQFYHYNLTFFLVVYKKTQVLNKKKSFNCLF